MNNRRRLIRLDVGDFLEIRPLKEIAKHTKAETKNFSLMGICFSSETEWQKGQVIFIDYFIPEELDSVKLKVAVVWSEFIDTTQGYFCGTEIIEIEEGKGDKFASYYFQKLRERFLSSE
ncbi:MAG: PilZ domain-containing protein [Candidatus Omnitrophota bacterium]|nr:MAG: PilZ domain-containing protein [Candidatus Omnitrophota bacterium]